MQQMKTLTNIYCELNTTTKNTMVIASPKQENNLEHRIPGKRWLGNRMKSEIPGGCRKHK